MALNQESGGTMWDRADEAQKIIDMGLLSKTDLMNDRESEFVSQMAERLDEYGSEALVSPKQLFWLRDLKEKYL